MSTLNLLETSVLSRARGISRKFTIRSASNCPGISQKQIADLYNSVIPDHSKGMRITAKHVDQRLSYDPDSIHLGFLDEDFARPVSLINILKLLLKICSDSYIPTTYQELTGDDTFRTTDPINGDAWFCPWVVSSRASQGLSLEWADVQRTVGRLHVLTVGLQALQAGTAKRLIAYSRPAQLMQRVEADLGFPLDISHGQKIPNIAADGNRINLDQTGVYIMMEETKRYIVELENLWYEMTDAAFRLHKKNGAEFRPGLVFVGGQIHDRDSLFYRTGLEYMLAELKILFARPDSPFNRQEEI